MQRLVLRNSANVTQECLSQLTKPAHGICFGHEPALLIFAPALPVPCLHISGISVSSPADRHGAHYLKVWFITDLYSLARTLVRSCLNLVAALCNAPRGRALDALSRFAWSLEIVGVFWPRVCGLDRPIGSSGRLRYSSGDLDEVVEILHNSERLC